MTRRRLTSETQPDPATNAALPNEQPAAACVMVIFGASGDLTKRLLIPSLYNLAHHNLLPHNFAVVGAGRHQSTNEAFRDAMRTALQASDRVGSIDPAIWQRLETCLYYLTLNYDDPAAYTQLAKVLAQCDCDHDTSGNYLYYLATPPSVFPEIAQQLGRAALAAEDTTHGWRRLIIEKPFGHDLDSARLLNRTIQEHFSESQIYRIDHYLGKETVQNVLVFRFANGMLEPVWNQHYIDHIQITVAETIGVETRGSYYDQAGLVRDMMQNHMMQLLALVTMEPPYSFASDAVRDEKAKVLRAMQPLSYEEVLTQAVRGQYGAGQVNGKRLPAYRDEPNVAPNSNMETYAAVKLLIDNWRWADVPFYLRSGKALPERLTEIVIQFRQAPHMLFRKSVVGNFQPNRLILHIQPNEGISWQFEAKVPGPTVRMRTVSMDFNYEDFFGAEPSTGYETLLHDAMLGDATLFQRHDFVDISWQIVAPLLDVWHNVPARNFPNYAARQAWGPAAADDLLQRDGRAWHRH
jgi:glucose-6-phosphate 1-dehydrogenase